MQLWLNGIPTTSDDILRHNEGWDVIEAVADLVSGRRTFVTLGGGASPEHTLTTLSPISPLDTEQHLDEALDHRASRV